MRATRTAHRLTFAALVPLIVGSAALVWFAPWRTSPEQSGPQLPPLNYQPRKPIDTSGLMMVLPGLRDWGPNASLEDVAKAWDRLGYKYLEQLDRAPPPSNAESHLRIEWHFLRATALAYEGQARRAYEELASARASALEDSSVVAETWMYTLIYFQGVMALRLGEDDNCVLCRGESSCIIPIAAAAVHKHPEGSRLAIRHFTEYLERFPDDLEVRWLLNLAHMTLGEYPGGVAEKQRLHLERYFHNEFDIGRFRDIGEQTGVNRLNQSGGAIMDDFDNDGLLDLVISCFDNTQPMGYFRNRGDGRFDDRTAAAGLQGQLGGLNCMQTDYDNDGLLDVFVVRGAWLPHAIRPSLLRNNGNGTFTDVTRAAGVDAPVNSIAAAWADYDNDGHLDLFVCCERQLNRLYRNKGDGTFEEVALKVGVAGSPTLHCKGAAWIDYDNDGWPDLFVNNLQSHARLYHNDGNGTFSDVTATLGIDGPLQGFACWAFDFDNDGWLDLFATSYDRSVADVVKGLLGEPHQRQSNRLFRNEQGKGFKDVTRQAGLDMVFATMGSNFADLDNDGYLDIYLGTGDPQFATLIPNRLFKNVAGQRFSEISTGTGLSHLQKGHGVACGDWDRNGTVDVFIEMGGATNGDRYHNVLFQNPGQGNHWLTVKLIGKKSNRAALGARLKAVTDGVKPLTVQRHISSGSSFGANPLQQTLGLGKATKVTRLEITWPTSKTVQVFENVGVNQAIEITELAPEFRRLDWKAVPAP